MDQIIIKTLLIFAFLGLGLIVLRSSGSARSQALRTLGLVLLLVAAITAVVFPGLIDTLAVSVGVGRGPDLMLYGFIVVFIGHTLSTARKRRAQDAQITELARQMALSDPVYPAAK